MGNWFSSSSSSSSSGAGAAAPSLTGTFTPTSHGFIPSSVPLFPSSALSGYLVQVTLKNNQSIYVQLDTGSEEIWFKGTSCVAEASATAGDASCQGNSDEQGNGQVNPSDPTLGLVNTGKTFELAYGGGDVQGDIYTITFSIGQYSVTLPVGITSQEKGETGLDGLIGLGFPDASLEGKGIEATIAATNDNFFDQLGFSGAQKIFGFYLQPMVYGQVSGEVSFGATDTTRYDPSKLVWFPVVADSAAPLGHSQWAFDASKATLCVGSTITNAPLMDSLPALTNALLDTGTTDLVLSTNLFTKVAAAIGADPTTGVIACTQATKGPVVYITFPSASGGSITVNVLPSTYVRGTGSCLSGISGGAEGMGFSLLGDTFLQNAYSIFDKNVFRLGLAPLLPSSSSSPSLTQKYQEEEEAYLNYQFGELLEEEGYTSLEEDGDDLLFEDADIEF